MSTENYKYIQEKLNDDKIIILDNGAIKDIGSYSYLSRNSK